MRDVTGKESYAYDAYGRRTIAGRPTTRTVQVYTQAGQLFYTEASGKGNMEYVYLNGSLLATRNSGTIKFQHTDALGSPIAVTDTAGHVVERTDYQPYGTPIGKTVDGIGYTGHAMDGATGLTYMQQRYYDQDLGRFLSVDPVAADSVFSANFNRYWYANNNPYRFTDPDGRDSVGQMIDAGADGCGPVSCAAWAGLKATWTVFGAESISQMADKGWSSTGGGAMVGAGLEIAAVLPPVKIARAGAAMVRVGQAGESAVRAVVDIGSKMAFEVRGTTRIPDGVTDSVISEVKNVKYQGYTSQIRDYAEIAKQTGRDFNLYVRSDTKISGPLREAAKRGDVKICVIGEVCR
ncbi:hypothetical protein C2859_18195 [Xanthomonas citri pv. glycines]|nr:hypothetical protein C2859_18195 [Xanthomonas citri pv. glycines]